MQLAQVWTALTAVQWSPYVVGIGIGILSWASLLICGEALGCSTSYARSAGMIEKAFRGKRVEQKPYYQKVKPIIDWQWMLVLGMVIGAFVAAQLSGNFDLIWVPSRWVAAFGDAVGPRLIAALLGGVCLGFGARWADGCTSGHGISGAMRLGVSSWISAVCFFVGGVATAFLLFHVLA
jgi:uncharacterized protein